MKKRNAKRILLCVLSVILTMLLSFPVMAATRPTEPKPDAPIISTARIWWDWIEVKWDKVGDIIHYDVYRSVDDGPYTKVASVRYQLNYYDNHLEVGHKFSYKIKAVAPYGTASKFSNKKSAYNIPLIKVNTESTASGIKVMWEKVPQVDGYKVHRRIEGESDWKYLLTKYGDDTTSFTNTSPQPGIWYEYMIRPFVKVNNTTYINWFDSNNKAEGIRVEKVTDIAVTSPASKKVQISWKPANNAAGYIVSQKKVKTGVCKNRYYTDVTTATFGVSGSGEYSYTIRAYCIDKKGNQFIGPFSAKTTVTVLE